MTSSSTAADPRIVRLEIAGPGANLLNPGVMADLERALLDADADPQISGILLTGAGESFCGGLDVPAIRAGGDPVEFASALVRLLRVFPSLRTPTTDATAQLSTAVGVGTRWPRHPARSGASETLGGQAISGGSTSVTVIVWTHVATPPNASVAVHVILVFPTGYGASSAAPSSRAPVTVTGPQPPVGTGVGGTFDEWQTPMGSPGSVSQARSSIGPCE